MKIYPSKHKIKSIPTSKVDTSLNIPLAYIDIDYTKNKVSKVVDARFSKNKKTALCPEQKFDNKDFKLFNKNQEEIINKDGLFQIQNNEYVYYPNNIVKFTPKKFLWKATVKRNYDYSISKTYDMKIGCRYDETLQENLIKTFMKPSSRDLLVHSNIKINSDNTMYSAFSSMNDSDLDFLFVKSHNCVHYDFDNKVKVNTQGLLQDHTNIWFGCEDAIGFNSTYKMLMAVEEYGFKVKNPIVTKECIVPSKYYFDLSIITPPAGVTVHNIFDSINTVPALILEYSGLGFVVITSYTIFNDLLKYESFMYEVMMYIHTKSYKSTEYISDWVAYNVPDYEINNGIFSVKSGFVSKKNIVSLLDLEGDYSLVHMDIMNDGNERILQPNNTASDLDESDTISGVVCIGQNGGCPIFAINSTLSGYIEPDKPEGWKSVYHNGSIYYLERLHYLIEEDITNKIMMAEQDNNLIVKLYGFKSSTYNINKQTDSTIQISYIRTDGELVQRIKEAEYTVYYIKAHDKIDFCYAEDYKESEDTYKLFNVLIEQSDDAIEVFDMRQLGGGLSEDEEDDFELLDIGHINGRPYRIAGALVLTMPSKYESHDEYIQKAIDKYKTAEDYIAVFYKDEEDD